MINIKEILQVIDILSNEYELDLSIEMFSDGSGSISSMPDTDLDKEINIEFNTLHELQKLIQNTLYITNNG